MTAIEYLKQLEVLQIKIQQKQREYSKLTELRSIIKAVDYSAPAIKSQPKGEAAFERDADKLITLAYEIKAEITEYVEKRHEIINTIQKLDSALYIKLLSLKFVDFRQTIDIAYELGYTASYTRQLISGAVDALDIVLNNTM